jgi:hypothetical protein
MGSASLITGFSPFPTGQWNRARTLRCCCRRDREGSAVVPSRALPRARLAVVSAAGRQAGAIELIDDSLAWGRERDVHLVQTGPRAFRPIGRSQGSDPQIGKRLLGASAQQECLRAVVYCAEPKRPGDRLVETTRFRQVRNDESGMVEHDRVTGSSEALFLKSSPARTENRDRRRATALARAR